MENLDQGLYEEPEVMPLTFDVIDLDEKKVAVVTIRPLSPIYQLRRDN